MQNVSRNALAILFLASPLAAQTPDALLVREWVDRPWDRTPPVSASEHGLAVGDVNGDGLLDVFAARDFGVTQQSEALWFGARRGYFVDRSDRITGPFTSANVAALADLDGDGDLDGLVTGENDSTYVYFNQPGVLFVESGAAVPGVLPGGALVIGDPDGDGDLDVFLPSAGGADSYLLNGGIGLFQDASVLLPSTGADSTGGAFGDLDQDGDVDLYVSKRDVSTDPLNEVYLNTGLFFVPGPALPGGGGTDVVLDDLDGNGFLDALTGETLHLNQGGAVFTDASGSLPVGAGALDFDYGDVDGDGNADMLGSELLFLSDGAGGFVDATGNLPARGGGAVSGDFDGDGDVDRLAVSAGSIFPDALAEPLLVLGNGAGGFSDVTTPRQRLPQEAILFGESGRFGDFDGDGDLDLVSAVTLDSPFATFEQKIVSYRNEGLGLFVDQSSLFPTEATNTLDQEVGDFDGDGDVDVLSVGRDDEDGTGGGAILRVNGGGAGFSNVPILCCSNRIEHVAIGDVDNDGDLDFVTGEALFGTAADNLLINDGFGGFTLGALPSPPEDTTGIEIFDLENDGDQDVVAVSATLNHVYRNEGALFFVNVFGQLPFSGANSLAKGDPDGDGDTDLLAEGSFLGWFWRYDGPAGYNAVDPGLPLPVDVSSATFYDANDDGLDDPLFLGPGGDSVLFLSDGVGFAVPAGPSPSTIDGANPGFGDFDSDGDVDLIAGGVVYANLSRQTSFGGTSRIGEDVRIDLWGSAGTPWALAAALGTARIPVGALGVLLLDPLSTAIIAGGVVDANGRVRLDFPLPNDAGLLGVPGYLQAAIGSPLRLTNADVDWIGDF